MGWTPWSARDALLPQKPARGSAADQGVRPTKPARDHLMTYEALSKSAADSPCALRRVAKADVEQALPFLLISGRNHLHLAGLPRSTGDGQIALPGVLTG